MLSKCLHCLYNDVVKMLLTICWWQMTAENDNKMLAKC